MKEAALKVVKREERLVKENSSKEQCVVGVLLMMKTAEGDKVVYRRSKGGDVNRAQNRALWDASAKGKRTRFASRV